MGYGARFFAVCGFLLSSNSFAVSQQLDVQRQVLQNLEALRSGRPDLQFQLDNVTGLPKNVTGLAATLALPLGPTPLDPTAQQVLSENARNAVLAFFANGGVGQQLFPQALSEQPIAIEKVTADPDFPGSRIVDVQQMVNGIPVFGAKSRVTVSPNAQVQALTSNFAILRVGPSTEPAIGKEAATQIAKSQRIELLGHLPDDLRSQVDLEEGTDPTSSASLSILDPSLLALEAGPTRLTWKVDIGNFSFFVDAQNGRVLHYLRNYQSLLARRIYDLGDQPVFPGQLAFDDGPSMISAGSPSTEAEAAYGNAATVYRFLADEFNRLSFDGADAPLVAFVRVHGLLNAQWCTNTGGTCPSPDVMVYGTTYTAALDVAAHEIGHGVIGKTAELIYSGEPGALNESLADLLGVLAARHGGDNNWTIGESLPGFSESSPVRNMQDPTLGQFTKTQPFSLTNRGQPDRYTDRVTTGDRICASSMDLYNACVHFNSGIVNRAFYLMSVGGSQLGIMVTGIGENKVERIVYRALVTKLGPTSRFADMASAAVDSCRELLILNLTTGGDCNQVANSFSAVGIPVAQAPDAASTTPVTPSALSNLTFTAPQAASGKTTFSDKCSACHGATLLGGFGPPLKGPLFKGKWFSKSVGDLFQFVSTNMPQSNPGSLTAQEYVNAIAFILQANGAHAGDVELPNDPTKLSGMGFSQDASSPLATTPK